MHPQACLHTFHTFHIICPNWREIQRNRTPPTNQHISGKKSKSMQSMLSPLAALQQHHARIHALPVKKVCAEECRRVCTRNAPQHG